MYIRCSNFPCTLIFYSMYHNNNNNIYNFPIGERLKDDSEELAAVVAAQGQDPDDTNDTQDS